MATKCSAQPDEELVGLYLREVGIHALLTRDEEVCLALGSRRVERPVGVWPCEKIPAMPDVQRSRCWSR